MKVETKKNFIDIANLLVTFRIATLSFLVWCCCMFMWIVGFVMNSFPATCDWTLAFYGTTVATLLPAIFKVFNDLRSNYKNDDHSIAPGKD